MCGGVHGAGWERGRWHWLPEVPKSIVTEESPYGTPARMNFLARALVVVGFVFSPAAGESGKVLGKVRWERRGGERR